MLSTSFAFFPHYLAMHFLLGGENGSFHARFQSDVLQFLNRNKEILLQYVCSIFIFFKHY